MRRGASVPGTSLPDRLLHGCLAMARAPLGMLNVFIPGAFDVMMPAIVDYFD
jgi:hypothetical protein